MKKVSPTQRSKLIATVQATKPLKLTFMVNGRFVDTTLRPEPYKELGLEIGDRVEISSTLRLKKVRSVNDPEKILKDALEVFGIK